MEKKINKSSWIQKRGKGTWQTTDLKVRQKGKCREAQYTGAETHNWKPPQESAPGYENLNRN